MSSAKHALDAALGRYIKISENESLSANERSIASDVIRELEVIRQKHDDLARKQSQRVSSKDAGLSVGLFGSVFVLAGIAYIPACFITQVVVYPGFPPNPGQFIIDFFKTYSIIVVSIALVIGIITRVSENNSATTEHSNLIQNQISALKGDIKEACALHDKWVAIQAETLTAMDEADEGATTSIREGIDLVASAKFRLDDAESEFKSGAFVAFWDKVERAAGDLSAASERIEEVGKHASVYDTALSKYAGSSEVPLFSISGRTIDELGKSMSQEAKRLNGISYEAQKDFHFATIYEQRRNTATVVEGFNSLGEAVNNIGDRIESAIFSLEETVSEGFRAVVISIDRVHDAVERVVEAVDRNTVTLSDAIDTTNSTLEERFNDISKHHRFSRASMIQALKNDHESLVMLDDIRHGREPSVRNTSSLYGTILDGGPRVPPGE
jgi:hypothetical protein